MFLLDCNHLIEFSRGYNLGIHNGSIVFCIRCDTHKPVIGEQVEDKSA